MRKVTITRWVVGICGMQVCAKNNITDEEILDVCNSQNPSGTSGGWSAVVREKDQSFFRDEKNEPSDLPVQCNDENRTHFIVLC